MLETTARGKPPAWRILVAGGGAPGLALALALTRELGRAVEVVVLDPALGGSRPDLRAYALSEASRLLLGRSGVWDAIAGRTEPILAMTITDSRVRDVVRPVYLSFGGSGEPLGHMIEAAILSAALRAECEASGIRFMRAAVSTFSAGPDRVVAMTSEGEEIAGALLVACDGARSRLREAAGIGWVGRRYRQTGIAATIAHEQPHGGRAIQHFLPGGPFALLPLPDDETGRHRSSIVWTEDETLARRLADADPALAAREISLRTGPETGEIELLSALAAHPLAVGLARSFVADRLALLGDAAHEIHPLAGQGLNLALGDVGALAGRIAERVRLGLDPGTGEVLAAYQRDRRMDALTLAATTDALNRLFSNDRLPVRVLRDIGLGLVDRSGGIKRFLETRAAGGSR